MLSRVASSLYWMARYMERADNVARFIDVNNHLMLDLNLNREATQWYPLVATSGDDENFGERYPVADERNVLKFLTFDLKNPNSILQCIFQARENARTVREIIPIDVWERINELYHLTQAHSRKRSVADLMDYYRQVRLTGHLMTGLLDNTMSRDQAWQFVRLGQMLERADKTARLLDVKYFLLLPHGQGIDTAYDAVQWGAVLKSVGALEMYRQQYHTINYRDVTDFLLLSKAFPRSLRFCLEQTDDALRAIASDANKPNRALAEMAILKTATVNSNAADIIASGLHDYIDVFQYNLNLVDTAIFETFFEV